MSLIDPDKDHPIIEGFADKPWPLLWADFIAEAKRFDGRKLSALFGDTNPVIPLPKESMEFTKRDRLLVGEFLRRHHPRLAHEIACFGVPAPQEDKLKLKSTPVYLADLAGLIARSHGLPLRSCFGYLEKNYALREYKGVHAVFHMALVRVADYLQVDAERAPKQALKVKQLRSPVSQREWKAHHAISDIRLAENDPEAIFIDARPSDVKTYLRIKELLSGLQTELDASWAAIGEVYGRFIPEGLDKFGLRLRRVHSNLDDEAKFAQTVDYVPTKAAFHTANAELLPLLVGPLYGNGPEFGIRELLQNAIDAVLELQKYQELYPQYKDVLLTDQATDVLIALDKEEDGCHYLTVSDCGIGMTAGTIRDYFLKAGASFRNSELWRRNFDGADGKSTVSRSGRFGIGVLASFLLGEEIYISTRYVAETETEGIEFSASVDAETIELRKIARPVGTTIKIRLENSIGKELEHKAELSDFIPSWDWYCLHQPSVQRLVNKNVHTQNYFVPAPGQTLPNKWRRLTVEGYSDVQWTYARKPFLTCNGIIVKRSGGAEYQDFGSWHSRSFAPSWGPNFMSRVPTGDKNADGAAVYEHSDANGQYRLNMPNVSVFDPDSRLPLNLQRTGLTQENYPFQDELLDSVLKDFIAYTLVSAPTSLPNSTEGLYVYDQFPSDGRFSHPGVQMNPLSESFTPFWFYTSQGISLADRWHFRQVDLDRLMIYFDQRFTARSVKNDLPLSFPQMKAHQAALRLTYQQGSVTIPNYSEGKCSFGGFSSLYIEPLAVVGQRILLPKGIAKIHISKESVYAIEWQSEHCILLRQGECPETRDDIMQSSRQLEEYDKLDIQEAFVSEMYLAKQQSEVKKSLVAEAWQRVVGDPIIPYDLEERRRKFVNAYETLEPYIAAYEAELLEHNNQVVFD